MGCPGHAQELQQQALQTGAGSQHLKKYMNLTSKPKLYVPANRFAGLVQLTDCPCGCRRSFTCIHGFHKGTLQELYPREAC